MPQGTRHLIIGDGAAGLTAAQRLRERDPLSSICILSDDPHPAYYRAALTNYLLGELTEAQIWAVTPTFFSDYRIDRVLARAMAVDTARAAVWLSSGGQPLPYDKLLIASGAHARPPPFEGAHLPGVATLRTLQDARFVMDLVMLHGIRRAVVIGGGPLAIEWAMALLERRVHVTLLVRETRVLTGALDAIGSDLVLSRMRQAGIDVRTGEEVHAAFPGPDGRVAGVVTKSGHQLACQLAGVAIGVVPNTYFLQQSGITLGRRGSIVVDAGLRTSAANAFAAGDVVELGGEVLQLWEPARRQALVAATNMTGGQARYEIGAFYFATRLADLDFASVGEVRAAEGCEELVDRSAKTGRIAYRKLLLREGKLVGALMLGHREERVRQRGRLFKRLVDERIEIAPIKKSLLDPGFDLQAWLRGRELVKKPPPPPRREAAAPEVKATAFVRGTQFVNLAAAAVAAGGIVIKQGDQVLGAKAAPAAGGPMLTIGLPKAAAGVQQVGAPIAYLEMHGRRWPLDAQVVSIGSDPQGQVAIADATVSHVHAQITLHNEECYLRDLGSRSGTWVNDAPVIVPHRLRHGDRIRVGSAILVFQRQDDRASSSVVIAPPQAGPVPHLEVRAGVQLGLRFALTEATATIGRDDANAVRIDDLSVSRRHAVLRRHGERWYLSDLHSSRGTLKNGVRLAPGEETPVAEGDQLQLGEVVLVLTR